MSLPQEEEPRSGKRAPVGEWPRLPLTMLPVAGGVGLVIYILADVSLPLAAGTLVLAGVLAWTVMLRSADPQTRGRLLRRVRIGLLAGLSATLAYDAARYGLVALLSWSIEPFHVWSLFGEALIGSGASGQAQFAVGTVYHFANGLGFAVAFVLIVRRPNWRLGVLWGLALELAMALLYPSWLRMEQLQKFITMSVLGHIVYGATLGQVAGVAMRNNCSESPTTTPVVPDSAERP